MANRFQWVLLKEKLGRYHGEQSRHNATLRTASSLCGRRNDLHIRATISDLRTSAGRQYQALDAEMQAATRQGSQDRQTTLTAVQSLEAANRRGFQMAEAYAMSTIGTITVNTRLLHEDNMTAQKHANRVTEKMSVKLESIHGDVSHNRTTI